MAYNQEIDTRIRAVVSHWPGSAAKPMFGGVCHLLDGHMFGGVYKDYLILRLGETRAAEALQRPHTRPFDITGKPMRAWVMVAPGGFCADEDLARWLDEARRFVETLPPK